MSKVSVRIGLLLVILACAVSCERKSPDVIGMFDLKYTLAYDLDETRQLLSLWDDIHTVSTLQGVVNRDQPRLFINYVVSSGIEIDTYWWNRYRRP